MTDWSNSTRELDHKAFSDQEAIALNGFQNSMRAEAWPDDPPRTIGDTSDRLRSIPPFVDHRLWAVWGAGGRVIVATATVETLEHVEHNQHLAFCGISVLPEMRRQGIAKHLLRRVIDVARQKDRRLLVCDTDSAVSAGEAFMQRLGAEIGITEEINQLDLGELNHELIAGWQRCAEEGASNFELGLWDGPFPDEDLDAVVELLQVMNTAPKDDLELEDLTWSADQVREMDVSWQERKLERWVLYARHVETGDLAGYTMVFWNPREPEILGQADTGVFPQYRGRGLGRWLKAAMIEKVLRDRPQVKRIRTENANSNAPMLKINQELGFKLYKTFAVWQVEVEKADAYLQSP